MTSLVDRLRSIHRLPIGREAADRIESLERENAELRAELADVNDNLKAAEDDTHFWVCRHDTGRRDALEEAAKVAEVHGRHLRRGESGLEYVDGNRDLAAAIRALAVSSPTPLQEQNANSGKEGE